MDTMNLCFGDSGARRIAFRALTGADERAASGNAHALLRRLAVPEPNCVHGEAIDDLTVGDRDRALAGLYRMLYDKNILADARCGECRTSFELRFDLDDLIAARSPDGSAAGKPPCIDCAGSVLRLPVVRDLSGTPETLLDRLVVSGSRPDADVAGQALEAADPAIELDLSGTCPNCETVQKVPFSLHGFLSATLRRDSRFLMREVHRIALAYGWELGTILSLTRSERQAFVRFILADGTSSSGLRRVAS